MSPHQLICAWDEHRTLAEWSELTGLGMRAIERRIGLGMTPELALSIPHKARVRTDVPPGYPSSWSWACLAFEDDDWARYFVSQHQNGATQEHVGEVLGIPVSLVRKDERRAVAKLMAVHGPDVLRQVLRGER